MKLDAFSLSPLMPFQDRLKMLLEAGPFFIYDLDGLQAHLRQLKQSHLALWYACKANPLSAILRQLHTEGFRFDVASEGELQQLIRLGVKGDKILMTGPAKTKRFLMMALQHRVGTVVIESERQLVWLETLVQTVDYQPKVLLRVQLQWESAESSVLGGHAITPFGMDIETVKRLVANMTLPLSGFHVFQWGNILSVERLAAIWRETLEQCLKIKRTFQILDVGGGLGLPYSPQESALAWESVLKAITDLKKQFGIDIWLELGRYMVGAYGYYLATVVDCKTVYGKPLLVLDGGSNHMVRPALVKHSFPATRLRAAQPKQSMTRFAIHGPLCTALDCLGEYALPSDTTVGDVIVFHQTGAYGFTESMPYFLCHAIAGEAVLEAQTLNVLRPPQSAMSWLV